MKTAKQIAKERKRRWSAEDTPPDLSGSGVPQQFWPTKKQYDTWWEFIRIPAVVSDDGWWQGRCPVHDPEQTRPEPTAEFMFMMGNFRCLVDEGQECHEGKGATTLSSMFYRLGSDVMSYGREPDWDSAEFDLPPEELAAIEAEHEQMEELAHKDWRRNPKAE